MRSLWRQMALAWLGGEGSAALSGDSAVLDALLADAPRAEPAIYRVTRQPDTARHAVLAQSATKSLTEAQRRINLSQE